jgi:hypothetical protein
MIAFIDPAARPALTVAGIFFVIIYVLAGVYVWRHRREWFGSDASVEGDRKATRYLAIIVICVPLLFLTWRVLSMLVGLWLK